MNRANTLGAEDWPEWNVDKNTPPVITVEGHHIQGVFAMIHTQLETLRNLSIEQGKALIEASRREERTNEKHLKATGKLNDRIEKLQQDIRDGETGKLTERLKQAEDRIKTLEQQISLTAPSAMKTTLDSHSVSTVDSASRIAIVERRLDAANIELQSQKVAECERQLSGMNHDRGDIHKRVIHLEDETVWYRNQAEKMNEEYAKLYDNNEVSSREIKLLRETVYNKHEEEIDRLFNEKLDISEAYGERGVGGGDDPQHGADETGAGGGRHASLFRANGANSDDIERLETLVADLDRRLLLLSAECSSDIEAVKHKGDKKIEHLQKWILKFVSEAMVKVSDNDEHGDYTDVGRMRCLVCNHPAKRLDPDTPYQKPNFTNTVGYLHDDPHHRPLPVEDGASYGKSSGKYPQPGDDPKYRVSTSPPHTHHVPPSTQAPSKSKFARLRAVPSQGAGGDGRPEVDPQSDNLISVIDITQDVWTRPKTGGSGKGNESKAFYREMER